MKTRMLKKYLFKHVDIVAVNGIHFSGKVVEYIYPEENENQMESIIVEDVVSDNFIEFYRADIKTITLEITNFITNLYSHATFEYNGQPCGIDPFIDSYDLWYGDKEVTVGSVEEVINTLFFDGKSLKDIWDEIVALEY